MKSTLSLSLLAALPLFPLQPHGGIFPNPPAPQPPPTGWSPTAYTPPAPGAAGGTYTGPTGPGVATGGARGAVPTSGSTPPAGSVPTGTRAPAASIPTLGAAGPEPLSWEFWWRYNRDGYLDLKSRVEAVGPVTISDGQDPTDALVARGIEAALAALDREHQRDLVSSLLVALARSCDGAASARAPEIAARCKPYLADPDQEIGETAAAALGILCHNVSIADLATLLHDDEDGRKLAGGRVSARTRAFAAYALGITAARAEYQEQEEFVAHHLARALRESSGDATADVASACVIAIGLVPITTEIDGGPIRVRADRLATDLPARSRAAQAALLIEFLQEKGRPDVARAHVPDALARIAIGASRELRAEIADEIAGIVERQAREDDQVVRGAVLALGRLAECSVNRADDRMRAALKHALDAKDAQARLFALVSLAQVACRPGEAEDPSKVQAEVQALLLDQLARGRSRERSWSAIALGILEHGRATPARGDASPVQVALRRALAGVTSPDQVGAIAIGLGLCGDPAATKDLLTRLEDVNDPTGRCYVATALGLLQATEAVPALRAILAKSRFHPEVMRETSIALALIGDVELVPTLLAELRAAKSLSSQAGIARALGFAGTLATVEPLAQMLADQSLTAGARAFSAVALGMVCDRERTPWNAFLAIGVNYPSASATLSDGGAGILDIL